jgi:hypothetical protein
MNDINILKALSMNKNSILFATGNINPALDIDYSTQLASPFTNAWESVVAKPNSDLNSMLYGTVNMNPATCIATGYLTNLKLSAVSDIDYSARLASPFTNAWESVVAKPNSMLYGTVNMNPAKCIATGYLTNQLSAVSDIDYSARLASPFTNAWESVVAKPNSDLNSMLFGTVNMNPATCIATGYLTNLKLSAVSDIDYSARLASPYTNAWESVVAKPNSMLYGTVNMNPAKCIATGYLTNQLSAVSDINYSPWLVSPFTNAWESVVAKPNSDLNSMLYGIVNMTPAKCIVTGYLTNQLSAVSDIDYSARLASPFTNAWESIAANPHYDLNSRLHGTVNMNPATCIATEYLTNQLSAVSDIDYSVRLSSRDLISEESAVSFSLITNTATHYTKLQKEVSRIAKIFEEGRGNLKLADNKTCTITSDGKTVNIIVNYIFIGDINGSFNHFGTVFSKQQL